MKIKVGHYVWLYFQELKAKYMMGGRTEGPFLVLGRTTRTFFNRCIDVADRVNIDSFRLVPAPTTETLLRNKNIDATPIKMII